MKDVTHTEFSSLSSRAYIEKEKKNMFEKTQWIPWKGKQLFQISSQLKDKRGRVREDGDSQAY